MSAPASGRWPAVRGSPGPRDRAEDESGPGRSSAAAVGCPRPAWPAEAARRVRPQRPGAGRRVLGEQPVDEPGELRRDLAADEGDGRRIFARVLGGELEGRLAGERWYAHQHLVDHTSEGVQIGGLRDLLRLELLRSHVAGGAHADAGAGQPGLVRVVDDAPHAEVEDLDRAALSEHDVGGLEVAVDDVGGVRGGETGCDLGAYGRGPGDGELSFLLDEVAQRLAVQELHREVGQAVLVSGHPARRRCV